MQCVTDMRPFWSRLPNYAFGSQRKSANDLQVALDGDLCNRSGAGVHTIVNAARKKCVRYLTAMVTEFWDWVLPTAKVTGTDGPGVMFDGICTLIWAMPATRPGAAPWYKTCAFWP